MTRFTVGLALVLFASATTRANDAEDKAVKFVEKSKGKITRDEKQPGKPVVGVDLSAEKVKDQELKELAPFKNLTTLKLNHNDIGDETLAELRRINLLHRLSDAEGAKGARPQKPADVTRLNLVFTKVTDEGLKELVELRDLAELYLNDTEVTHKGLGHLAKLTNLTTLALPDKAMTDQSLAELRKINLLHALAVTAAADGKRPKKAMDVIRLDLQKTLVTDNGLKELADLTSLTELHLFETKVTGAGFKNLAKLTNLTTLNLHTTKVTDAELKELAPLKKITTLNLDDTGVSDEGLKHLAKLTNLTTLTLHGTKVTGKGLKELTVLTNLAKLHVPDSVTEKDAEEFKKALPKCLVK